MADKNIDGFRFSDAEDADTARQELDRIKYIAERINEESPQAVLAVYNKSIQSNIFLTPVGLEYLRSLQRFLYKSEEIPDDQIMDIPVRISFNDALRQRTKKRFDSIDEDKRKKNFKNI